METSFIIDVSSVIPGVDGMKARPVLVIMGDGSQETIPNDDWAHYSIC